MALYKRSKNGPYYMNFTLYGKRVNRSTGMYNKVDAEGVEAEERKRIRDEVMNPKPMVQEKKPLLLSEAIERTYDERWCKNADGLRTYQKAKKIVYYLGDKCVSEISNDDITLLKTSLSKKGLSDATTNRYLAYLRTVLNLSLRKWGQLSKLPYIEMEEESEGRIRVVSDQEEQRLIETFLKMGLSEMADLVVYLVDTGMRLTNALEIGYNDMDFKQECIRVWKQKGKKPYSVPMTSRVKELLERRRAVNGIRPFTLNGNVADKLWRKARVKMIEDSFPGINKEGIEKELERDPDFTPHALRHTCASRLVESGVDLYTVKEWLGHSTIKVTERYAHLRPKQLLDAKDLLEKCRKNPTFRSE